MADLIADSINRYTSVFAAAPALAQLEANVDRLVLPDRRAIPPEARGTLTSGGSLANLTALVTARRERLPENFLSGRDLRLRPGPPLGGQGRAPRRLPGGGTCAQSRPTSRFRLRVDALAERPSRRTARRGLTPFLIVASAGTTNTGAVDPLAELADLAAREGLWLHVDAAYGGFFLLTEEGNGRCAGIERADSIVLDPHKGLFLPYGTGAVLVRDGQALRRAHSLTADYMPAMQNDPDRVDFSQYSPELSRPFRGLRVWLPFKMHGAGAFRAQLEEKLALARLAADRLRGDGGDRDPRRAPALPASPSAWPRRARPTEELNRLNQPLPRPDQRPPAGVPDRHDACGGASPCGSASSPSAPTATGWRWRWRTSRRRSGRCWDER